MWTSIVAGAALRFCEALLQASPTILVGVFVAGILRCFVGPESTYRLFGCNTKRGLLQAWAIGMLLPVCSLGVLPVIREMKRTRLSGGTILAFALAAPLFNPLSLLYGLTLSKPITILAFALCSLIVVTLVGALWDRFFPVTDRGGIEVDRLPTGLKRTASVAIFCARELTGPSALYILAGLSGVIALTIILPQGCLQRAMSHSDPSAPLVMSAIAVPAYATPMLAMGQLGTMFQHGNSVGAAFVLLAFGAGMNLGTVAWMWRCFGLRKSLAWIGLLLTVVLALSYGIEAPLFPPDAEQADHTHAFDVYCRPYPAGTVVPPSTIVAKLRENARLDEIGSLGALLVIVLAGVGLRLADGRGRIQAWLERTDPIGSKRSIYNRDVPGWAIGGCILLGLVAISVVGCYAYYPPPSEVFEEMRIAKAEALGAAITGRRAHAEQWIAIWDDWTRKLQVGTYLRAGDLSDYRRMKAYVLREKLELLEHGIAEADKETVRHLAADVNRAYLRLRRAYDDELLPPAFRSPSPGVVSSKE
jgi:uncharacterized membrane protein YraQ (UPF0718 family)